MSEVWAITCYYNPLRWKSRLRNYRIFREQLQLPLITVEWHPEEKFQLGDQDAEILLRRSGGDLMWQKERLLEIGLGHLPSSATSVAWIDCDVVFGQRNPGPRILKALERHPVIQLFSEAVHVSQSHLNHYREYDPVAGGDSSQPSSAKIVSESGIQSFETFHHGASGLAWAARKDVLLEVGLFDRAVVGSGDFLMLLATLGISDFWFESRRHLGYYDYLERSTYSKWARRVFEKTEGCLGFIDQTLYHLPHGRLVNRRYLDRHGVFNAVGIDLAQDLELTEQKVWRFRNSAAKLRDMMKRYFEERREDEELRDP